MTRSKHRRGANALEFALIFPIFWLLLGGAADLGWLFYHQSILDAATVVGCRAGAIVDPGWNETDMANVEQAANDAMIHVLDAYPGTYCDPHHDDCYLSVTPTGTAPGRSLICRVERDFTPIIGVAARPVRLHSAIAVRMEWQRWP